MCAGPYSSRPGRVRPAGRGLDKGTRESAHLVRFKWEQLLSLFLVSSGDQRVLMPSLVDLAKMPTN